MKIDDFYENHDKSNFYLGKISFVSKSVSHVQVENLSLIKHRRINAERLVPNAINYLVVVDSVHGLFIGEIVQAKVNTSESIHSGMNDTSREKIYPEFALNVFGLLRGKSFDLAGFKTVGISDNVYIANTNIVNKYIESLETNHISGSSPLERIATLGNFEKEIDLNPNTLFNRHLMAIGTTNSGKSTSALSILDKMVKSKRKILLIDPTGEYRDSFNEKEMIKLKLSVDTVLPIGEVTLEQWSLIFQTNDGSQDVELMKAIHSLQYQSCMNLKDNSNEIYEGIYKKYGKLVDDVKQEMQKVESLEHDGSFDLSYLADQILEEAVVVGTKYPDNGRYVQDTFRFSVNMWLSDKVKNILRHSKFQSFFSHDNSKYNLLKKIDEFISNENTSLYIDTSEIGTSDTIGSLIIDVISKYVVSKKREKINPFVMYIDEVHRYTSIQGGLTSGLIEISREGRKKGVFLFLTTQNPKDVPPVLLGQVGSLIVHRLTQSEELASIQNKLSENTLKQVQKLNQGEAILASINLLENLQVKFSKANRNHQNDTPVL